MIDSGKLRADSYFAQLPPDLKTKVDDMLFAQKYTCEDIQKYLTDSDQPKISLNAISKYYNRHIRPMLWQGRQEAARILNTLKTEEISEATHKLVCEKMFDAVSCPGTPTDDIVKMYTAMLKREKQTHDARKLDFEIERYEILAAKALLDKALSPEVQAIVGGNQTYDEKIALLRPLLFGEHKITEPNFV